MAFKRKINFDYFNIFNELPLFCGLVVRHAFRKKGGEGSNALLIVNACLIGEFAASAPVMREYMMRHPGQPVDLIVSPQVRPLAERMQGVRTVYTAKSVFRRASEGESDSMQLLGSYERIIVLRISPEIFRLLGRADAQKIETALRHFVAYGLHLGWNLVRGKTPRPWREVNIRALHSTRTHLPFEKIFSVDISEVDRIRALPALAGPPKKILIHTGASWAMNSWRTQNWVALLTQLHASGDYSFIFVGANKDMGECAEISRKLSFATHSLIGQVDLWELLLVMRACDYFLGVDSGPRNLAHLADLPSVTLLGPAPHMYTPPDPRDIVIDHSRGRGLYERFFSRKKSLINTITPQEVMDAFMRLRG